MAPGDSFATPGPITQADQTWGCYPNLSSAKLNQWPAAIAATRPRPTSRTGNGRSSVVASPSWPYELTPQAQTVPSCASAKLWAAPAAIARIPMRPLTGAGEAPSAVVPSPSWPPPRLPTAAPRFPPQAQTVPSDPTDRLCTPPPAIAMTALKPTTDAGRLLRNAVGSPPSCP